MYVLIRHDDRKYVARPGSEHSYTRRLEEARTWPTKEAAEPERCENESCVSVASIMGAE